MGLMHPVLDVRDDQRLKTTYPTGFVVDNKDPLKRGRVRVRIPGLHPKSIPNDKLPWLMPHQTGYANAGKGVGNMHVPPMGAKLHVMFDGNGGDPHNGYFKHSPPTEDVHKDNPLSKHPNYPHVYGWQDEGNNLFYVDTKGKEAGMKFADGSSIIFKNGSFTTTMKGDITSSAKGKQTTKAGRGGVTIHSDGGAVSMKGETINQNGSDATEKPEDPAERPETNTSTNTYDNDGNMTA